MKPLITRPLHEWCRKQLCLGFEIPVLLTHDLTHSFRAHTFSLREDLWPTFSFRVAYAHRTFDLHEKHEKNKTQKSYKDQTTSLSIKGGGVPKCRVSSSAALPRPSQGLKGPFADTGRAQAHLPARLSNQNHHRWRKVCQNRYLVCFL